MSHLNKERVFTLQRSNWLPVTGIQEALLSL